MTSLWSKAARVVPNSSSGAGSPSTADAPVKGVGKSPDDYVHSRAAAELFNDSPLDSPSMLEEQVAVEQLLSSPELQAEQRRDPNFTLLHFVSLLGHTTLAGALTTNHPTVHQRFARIAAHLIKEGHDVYVPDQYGCIPLQLAASSGNVAMVTALMQPFDSITGRTRPDKLTRNVYLNHQDTQIRFTALHGALSHCQYQVAVLLLQHGANPQILDITRNNAFQVAPNLEALEELLHMVVENEDIVPTPAIAQLMIEVIKQQEEREKKERQRREQAEKAAGKGEGDSGGSDDKVQPMQWAKMLTATQGNPLERAVLASVLPLLSKMSNLTGADPRRVLEGRRKSAIDQSEVTVIVKRLFRDLYIKQKHEDIWEYVRAAVDYNNYRLTQMMLDTICVQCPSALSECNWEGTLGPLIACFPDLFHTLIKRLEDMPDSDVVGFVKSMKLSTYYTDRATQNGAAPPAISHAHAGISITGRSISSSARVGGKAGAAAQGKILIYQQLVEGLRETNYVVIKAFFENCEQELLNDMAQFPIFKDFVTLIATKSSSEGYTASDSGRTRLLDLLKGSDVEGLPTLPAAPSQPLPHVPTGTRALPHAVSVGAAANTIAANGSAGAAAAAAAANGGEDPNTLLKLMMGGSGKSMHGSGMTQALVALDPDGEAATGVAGSNWRSKADLAVQTLNVRRVLTAAVHARKSMNVDAAVKAITTWVDANSKDKRTVFISGIHTSLLKDMSTRFPTSTSKLLNLVSKEVLGELTTLQVSASLLHRKEQVVKCSDVRNNFTWRAPELQQLYDEKGFDEGIIDALADYGIPFECTFKAAMEFNTTKEHFAALIGAQFTGQELRDLISNGIQLSRITDIINICSQAPACMPREAWKADQMTTLLKDMLREKLSFRIVEAILDAGVMNEATVYTNFRPGNPLYNTFPPDLYRPRYTHHFVQLLLTNWKKGTKDMAGNWTFKPWDKKFVDSIFAPNDPLCTALKSAYDNKLKDTPVYLDSTSDAVHGWAKKQRRNLELVLKAFVCNPLLVHRWPVFFFVHCALVLHDLAKGCWTALGLEWDTLAEQQGHSIDAKALVIPWQGIADVGEQVGILTGLIDVDVPVRWFGFTAVKAAISVQWQEFGQTLMLMGSLAHITFMVLFGVFLLIVRRHGEQYDGDMDMVRREPEVIALLCVLGILSLGGLMEEGFQMAKLTWRTWRNYLGNLVDLTSFSLFVVIFGMVWACYDYPTILAVGAVETLVLFVRLVFFASMTDSMGSLMRMVIEIMKDMRYFFLLLGMIFGGFAIAFAVMMGPDNSYRNISFKLFTVMLGDFQASDLVGMVETPNMWYTANLSVLLMCLYGILIGIVLINLLIAIMNDTYDRIKETEEVEVLHNRARLIVDLESLLTDGMREQLQRRLLGRYLHVLLPADHKTMKFMAADEGGDGDWKGRMRHMRDIVKNDLEGVLNKRITALEGSMRRDLEPLHKWVKAQPDFSSLGDDDGR